MPQHVLIVGGGVGGTIVANLLARRLSPQEAEITLVDSTARHMYMPMWLYMPFDHIDRGSSHLVRDEQTLLNRHVHLVQGQVSKIDPSNREVHVRQGNNNSSEIGGTGGAVDATYAYDYLVLATGARLVPSDLMGLEHEDGTWHHFYSTEGALRLRQALQAFEGGRILITVGGMPYRCPPAPLEFTFLLEEWLHKQGLRQRTEIEYLFPLPRVFPIESVAEVVTPMLEERGIKYTVFFNVDQVDTEHKVIFSMEEEERPYDLLVIVPPHRGSQVIEDSDLGDEQGWLPTDRHTLEVKGQKHVYALGDATDLPVSKSGSAAHFEAKVVAHRLIAQIRGEALCSHEGLYDGEVMCFLEAGQNKATQLVFNYEHPPHPPRPGLYYHMEKQLLNRAYWHLVPQGLV